MTWTKSKRIIAWIFAGLVALVLLVTVAGYFILNSLRFRQYAMEQIVKQTDLATGGKLTIGSFDFRLGTLTAHLHDITLRGTEALSQPPLLHADDLTVSFKIASVLHRQLILREVILNRPSAYILRRSDGTNNLPAPPRRSQESSSSPQIAIAHAQLLNGEATYNDRTVPLDADLQNLSANVRSLPFSNRYQGELSYQNGQIRYAQYSPLPHDFALKFSATPEQFDLQSARLHVGTSEVVLQGDLHDYANPAMDGSYTIRVHAQDFAQIAAASSPAGDASLTGKFHYQCRAGQPAIQCVSLAGQLASQELSIRLSQNRVPITNLSGEYQIANGTLRLSNINLESLGGRIAAAGEITHLDATPNLQLQASLASISIRSLQRMFGAQTLSNVNIAGVVNGRVEAAGNLNNLRARSDLTIRAAAANKSNGEDIPVNGAVHASYQGAGQIVEFHDTSITLPSITLTANGTMSFHSNLQVQIASNDLHEADRLAAIFVPRAAIAISGSATVAAQLNGSLQRPNLQAQLKAQNLKVEGSEWSTLQATLLANQSQVELQNGSVISADRGQASFTARVGLHNWSYAPQDPVVATLDAKRLNIADLLRLARQQYPVSGELNASIHFQGSQTNPAGSGDLRIANAELYGEPVSSISANFRAAHGSVQSTLSVAADAGAANADISYTPGTHAYSVRLNAPSIAVQKIHAVQIRNAGVSGTVQMVVNGHGTIEDPELSGNLELSHLMVRQNAVGTMQTTLRVQNHAADVALDSQIAQAPIHIHGHVALSGNYELQAAIDTGVIPLQTLLSPYAPGVPAGLEGKAELHATATGPLKDVRHIEAHISIPALEGTYQSLQLGITQPVKIDYANSVVNLQPAEIKGTGTSLRISGHVPLAGNESPTLLAQGSADLRVAKLLDPDLDSSGTIALDLRATGSSAHPAVQGQIQLKNASFSTADAPVGLSKLNGTIAVDSTSLQFSNMDGQIGGGEVHIGGSVYYRPAVQFNLALQAKSVHLLYPDGLRSSLDASLAYSGGLAASTLNGRVLLNRLSFTPDFDLSKFADQFSTSSALSQPGFADTIQLAVVLQSQDLSATSSQVSIAGSAALRVGGTAANPVITGRTTITAGELFYRNVRYQLQNGIITFDDPTQTHPVLNVSATTTIEEYKLTLSLRGPLDKLTTFYSSDPPLATADIINLVARGKTTQESAAQAQTTDSMIASQAASELSGGLQKLAGLSSISIDPTMGGNGQSPSTQIAVQQRVTKNLLFTFSTDVSQPGSEMVQGEYQINPRWSVTVERDQLGGFSTDARYHKRF